MAIKPTPELSRAIENFKKGDAQAFEALYNHSLPYLTKCVLTVINRTTPGASEDLVQDILQDTYLTIAEKIGTLQNEEAFYQWAGQIATNHALRTWNKEHGREAMEQSEDDMLYELADEDFIPEDILENKEKQQLIRKMLQELPTGQYLCLVEYFYNGLKEREIAEKLDMPLGTVKTNLSRAKKKLKEIVETHEKKHGVKLYSMSWLLILLFLDDIKDLFISPETAGTTLSAVTSQIPAAGATGAAGGTAGAAGATALTAKIVAGIVAAALVAGGVAVAFTGKQPQDPPAPTVAQTLPVTEPESLPEETQAETLPQPAPVGDVILLPEELAYMNRVANSMELGALPSGPMLPYEKEYNNLNITPYVINCAGNEGLLKGNSTKDGIQISKADLEAFMLDTLGCVKEIVTDGTYGIRQIDEDTYLFKNYNGNRKQPVVIYNLQAINQNRILVQAAKEVASKSSKATLYHCVFERSADSQYGWILTKMTDPQKTVYKNDVMVDGVFTRGIVLSENGKEALALGSDSGELSMAAAEAYVRQYLLATTGNIPATVVAEEWGLVANSYFTHKVTCKNALGATTHCFLVGTNDNGLFDYDETTKKMTEIFWTMG